MDVKKKIVPVICLMAAYVHLIKPRMLSASASKGGKSLLLHLCARSRLIIPMIVFTAFWIFDAQMQIEASISLTLSRNVRITLGPGFAQSDVDSDDNADDYVEESIDLYPDSHSTTYSDVSIFAFEDVENAIQEFADHDLIQGRDSFRTEEQSQQ